jgi:hypothetical protein
MKRRDFICKEGADLYYLVHVVGMMSLGYAAETEWLPKPVRSIARIYLEGMPGEVQPT